MKLKPLIKDKYTIDGVCTRWNEVHEDYDYEYLNEKIASGEIPAYLDIKNCYLFPVDEIGEAYDYLELCDTTVDFKTKILVSFFVKAGVFKAFHNDTVYKSQIDESEWPTRSEVFASLVIGSDLGLVKPIYRYHVVNSCDLLNPNFSIDPPKINSNRQVPLNTKQSIIKVSDCGLPVTPLYWVEPLGISYIQADAIPGSLEPLNLSSKKDNLFGDWLSRCCVVEFNGSYYYVVNEKSYEFEGELLHGYSLARDVVNSYDNGRGVVILRSDLEAFEKSVVLRASSYNQQLVSLEVFKDEKLTFNKSEQTLGLMLSLMDEFVESEDFKKYGTKTPQGNIEEWLKPLVPKSNRKSEDGSKKPNRDYIRVLKVLISERYGITTLRSSL